MVSPPSAWVSVSLPLFAPDVFNSAAALRATASRITADAGQARRVRFIIECRRRHGSTDHAQLSRVARLAAVPTLCRCRHTNTLRQSIKSQNTTLTRSPIMIDNYHYASNITDRPDRARPNRPDTAGPMAVATPTTRCKLADASIARNTQLAYAGRAWRCPGRLSGDRPLTDVVLATYLGDCSSMCMLSRPPPPHSPSHAERFRAKHVG